MDIRLSIPEIFVHNNDYHEFAKNLEVVNSSLCGYSENGCWVVERTSDVAEKLKAKTAGFCRAVRSLFLPNSYERMDCGRVMLEREVPL